MASSCFLLLVAILGTAAGSPRIENEQKRVFGVASAPYMYTQDNSEKKEESERATTCGHESLLSTEQIQATLDAHNAFRVAEEASNMLAMTWSDEIAARAQELTDTCVSAHGLGSDCSGGYLGQNLFATGGTPDMKSVVKDWADERPLWNFETGQCNEDWKKCAHYTQVVWARSSEVGCGMTKCGDKYIVACNYRPGGNDGNPLFLPGTRCSNCDSDNAGKGYKCVQDLCTPCSPLTDATCKCGQAQACQNGGKWNVASCKCDCPKTYYGALCQSACSCSDASPYCDQWTQYCADPLYEAFMKEKCMATCKFTCNLPASCA